MKFYKVNHLNWVDWYEYLCPIRHDYHVVLKHGAIPDRMYHTELEKVYMTLEEATAVAISNLEHHIKLLKEN